MEIKVKVKTHYGLKVVEPYDEKALLFASIAGTKFLTPKTISSIKALGYKVVVIADELPEL